MIGLPAFIPYPWQGPGGSDFPFRTFAMLTGLLTIWLVSRVTGKIDPPQPLAETAKQDCSPSAE